MANEQKIKWDGTINVPTIIMAASILVGGVTFANAMSSNVNQLVNSVGELRTDIKNAQVDISDIKARLSVLEERTRREP